MRLTAADPAVIQRLLALARGRTTREIAGAVGVKPRTLKRWLNRHKDVRTKIRNVQPNMLFD